MDVPQPNASFEDEEELPTLHQSSGDQTPTPTSGIHRSRSPLLNRTPSLVEKRVDELLSQIYSRFGNGYDRSMLDSSQRASASGSQVQ